MKLFFFADEVRKMSLTKLHIAKFWSIHSQNKSRSLLSGLECPIKLSNSNSINIFFKRRHSIKACTQTHTHMHLKHKHGIMMMSNEFVSLKSESYK